jgi:hypothetical protein
VLSSQTGSLVLSRILEWCTARAGVILQAFALVEHAVYGFIVDVSNCRISPLSDVILTLPGLLFGGPRNMLVLMHLGFEN